MSDEHNFERHYKITWWVKNYDTAIYNWTLIWFAAGLFYGFSITYCYERSYYWCIAIITIPIFVLVCIFVWWMNYYKIPEVGE